MESVTLLKRARLSRLVWSGWSNAGAGLALFACFACKQTLCSHTGPPATAFANVVPLCIGRGAPRVSFHQRGTLQIRCLNRLLLERHELSVDASGTTQRVKAVLTKSDPRVKHVRKILKANDGATLRIGLVDAGREEDAVVRWDADGDLLLEVPPENEAFLDPVKPAERPPMDLLLALPRPANLAPFLNLATQLGVHRVILCNAAKVQADYFGSHLLKEPRSEMREALKTGLAQAGDTALPEVHVARRLKPFLEDELEQLCPDTLRLFGHPQKEWAEPLPAMREVDLGGKRRMLLAVGPEAGWQDPYELELLQAHGFRGVTLGERTLRTDVALVALMTLAHDVLRGRAE